MAASVKFPRINEQIRKLGINQSVVAERLGMAPSTVSDKLNGRTDWTLPEGVRLAQLVGMSVNELTDGMVDAETAEPPATTSRQD